MLRTDSIVSVSALTIFNRTRKLNSNISPETASSSDEVPNDTRLKSYVRTSRDGVLSTDRKVLLCKVCKKKVIAYRESQIVQHLNGVKHNLRVTPKKLTASSSPVRMAPFLNATGKQSQFSLDFCNAFLVADMPLHEELRELFQKYIPRQELVVSAALRQNYIKPACFKCHTPIPRCRREITLKVETQSERSLSKVHL